ncbi:MAG: hypothetical protein U0359_20275 [Byssovorax sp.]
MSPVRERFTVATLIAFGTAGCCPIFSVRIAPHEWNVLVEQPKETLAALPRDRPIDLGTCATLCPDVTMAPGGPIKMHLSSCHVAPLDKGEVLVCRGNTEGGCAERSFTRREGGELVAMERRCGSGTP